MHMCSNWHDSHSPDNNHANQVSQTVVTYALGNADVMHVKPKDARQSMQGRSAEGLPAANSVQRMERGQMFSELLMRG